MIQTLERNEVIEVNGIRHQVQTRIFNNYISSKLAVYAVDHEQQYLNYLNAGKINDVIDFEPILVTPIHHSEKSDKVLFNHCRDLKKFFAEMGVNSESNCPVQLLDEFRPVYNDEIAYAQACLSHISNYEDIYKILNNPCLQILNHLNHTDLTHDFWKNMHHFAIDRTNDLYGLRLQFNDQYTKITELAIVVHHNSINRNNHIILDKVNSDVLDRLNQSLNNHHHLRPLKSFLGDKNPIYKMYEIGPLPF